MEVVKNSADDFDIVELRMMQLLCPDKSIMYIAAMIERPFAAVERKVKEIAAKHGIKLHKPKGFERKIKERQWAERQLKTETMKIRKVDESQLISIRIDSKTIVRVKSGTDIAEVRAKYSKKIYR